MNNGWSACTAIIVQFMPSEGVALGWNWTTTTRTTRGNNKQTVQFCATNRTRQHNTHKKIRGQWPEPHNESEYFVWLLCVFLLPGLRLRGEPSSSHQFNHRYNSHSAYRFEVIWASGERNSTELVGGGKTQSKKLRPIFQPFFALDPFLFFHFQSIEINGTTLHHR
jgi:hypothetical protein